MKNVVMVALLMVSFLSAEDFNSTSVETQERILELCKNYQENILKKYQNNPLWKDRKFVHDYAGKCIYTLEFADKKFRNDREIVEKAIAFYARWGYCYSSNVLKKDRNIVKMATENSIYAFQCLSKFKDDKEVVSMAVKNSADNLKYANSKFRNDKTFILTILNSKKDFSTKWDKEYWFENLLKNLGKNLRKDKDIMDIAIQNGIDILEFIVDLNSTSVETQERILELISKNKHYKLVKYKHNPLWKNKEFILRAIEKSGWYAFEYASEELKSDKTFVLDVVDISGNALRYADNKLKNDREVVLRAVKNDGYALTLLNNKFKDDKEIVLEAVSDSHHVLKSVSSRLHDDKEVVLKSINLNGQTLEYASQRLRDDKEVVLAALKSYKYAMPYVSNRLKKDKEVINLAIKRNIKNIQYASEVLRDDKEYMLEKIKRDGSLLKFASNRLKKDKEILLAVLYNISYVKYLNSTLQNNKDLFYNLLDNKEIILDAVVINRRVFQYISERLKKDRDVVLNALKVSFLPFPNPNIKYVDKTLLNDKEIVLLGLSSDGMFLEHVDEKLKNDKDVVKQAFKNRSDSLQFASDMLKNDKEFMFELANMNYSIYDHIGVYDYIGDTLKKDKEFMMMISLILGKERFENMDMIFKDNPKIVLKAMEQGVEYFRYASERLRNDKEFVLSFVAYPKNASILMFYGASIIKYVTKKFKNNKKTMLEVIKKNPLTYRWIGKSLKEDRDICLATVQDNGTLLKYLSPKCRLDREIVKAAVLNNGYALKYASSVLKKDKDLIALAKNSKPYKSRVKHTVYPKAWKSYSFNKTLKILYGKDANLTQSKKLKVGNTNFLQSSSRGRRDGIKIETDLKLKSIAILQDKGKKRLVAWYPILDGKPVNLYVSIRNYGKYTVIGEGLDGKLYMNTYTRVEYQNCFAESDKHEFFKGHLKRRISYINSTAHLELMIVNDTLESDQRKRGGIVTKVRIEADGKTVFTMHTSEDLGKNPYFAVDLVGVKKDENITIYVTDTLHRKEYIWEL